MNCGICHKAIGAVGFCQIARKGQPTIEAHIGCALALIPKYVPVPSAIQAEFIAQLESADFLPG